MWLSGLSLLLLGLTLLASSLEVDEPAAFEARQIQPISLTTSGQTTKGTTSSSTQTSSSSASSSSARTTSSSHSTSTGTGYDLVLTTTFTQPSGCSDGLTAVPQATSLLWQNIINPVPGVTLTSCFPPQFYSSALATASLAPFKQLVCPYTWQTFEINSTYIICCPDGFGLYAPNYTYAQRPALSALCTSLIFPGILMDITSYVGSTTSVAYSTAGVNGTLVIATPFDGAPATAAATTSTKSSISTTSSTSTKSTSSAKSTTTTAKTTAKTTSITAITQLPACGQTCFSNLLAQYSTLGCGSEDPACLCRNVNFGYGITDCANGACGPTVGSTVIAFETRYCASATSARTTFPTTARATATITGIAQLPACGQTCFSNILAQHSTLGCSSAVPSCLCKNVNFGYGIRDCANGACGTAVASTVIAFESRYCSSGTAAPARKL